MAGVPLGGDVGRNRSFEPTAFSDSVRVTLCWARWACWGLLPPGCLPPRVGQGKARRDARAHIDAGPAKVRGCYWARGFDPAPAVPRISLTQMFRKLIAGLGSPCDCSLMGVGPWAL